MYAYFQQPYPHQHKSLRQRSLTAVGVGVFVGLFLNFFQPFGSYLWQDPAKPYILGGYGVVTFICLMLVNMIVPTFFKQWYAEESWTVAKEIGWSLLIIMLIALGNMISGKIIFGRSFSLTDVLSWLAITGAIGIMPATVVTMINYVQLARRYETKQLHIPSNTNTTAAEAVVTSTLGITAADLKAARDAGKSLATLAGDKKAALITALVNFETTEVDAAVTAGKLTAAQATTMKAGLTARVTAKVEAVPGPKIDGMGKMGKEGMGKGKKMQG
jgi:hypothetical protein